MDDEEIRGMCRFKSVWIGEGKGNPLQYSRLENPMGRGAWLATVHGVTRVGHDSVTKPGVFGQMSEYKNTPKDVWIEG